MASTRAMVRRTCALEDVEGDDRGDGDHQADRGGHQRLGDAGHDRRGAAALVAGQVGEGLDDAEHGAEQADEGGVVAQRAEHAQVAFQRQPLARLGAGHRLGGRVAAAAKSPRARPAATRASGVRRVAEGLARAAMSPLPSSSSSSRASASGSGSCARQGSARSTITATDSTDRPMSSHSTHSEPSRVNASKRSVIRMVSQRFQEPQARNASTDASEPAGHAKRSPRCARSTAAATSTTRTAGRRRASVEQASITTVA